MAGYGTIQEGQFSDLSNTPKGGGHHGTLATHNRQPTTNEAGL